MNLWETSIEDWKMLVRWCRTDICSCKLSAKVFLMLGNPFLVPSLFKLNHISVCFIQIRTKSAYSLQESNVFFWSHPRCFGPLGKFQHNIKISIKTARVSRLYVLMTMFKYTSTVSKEHFLLLKIRINRNFQSCWAVRNSNKSETIQCNHAKWIARSQTSKNIEKIGLSGPQFKKF